MLHSLRRQYEGQYGGWCWVPHQRVAYYNKAKDDALLTSCCLVAGMYPNICTLTRPRKISRKGGLLTKMEMITVPARAPFKSSVSAMPQRIAWCVCRLSHNNKQTVSTGHPAGQKCSCRSQLCISLCSAAIQRRTGVQNNALIVDGRHLRAAFPGFG
jgi:hypothetical protein